MEMTFPHFASLQDSVSRVGHGAMLDAVIARQANSRTVRVMRQAEAGASRSGDEAEGRICYFARHGAQKLAVRGAFWRNIGTNIKGESDVYQAGSTNIKVLKVNHDGTGEQLNHAGHGALRKL